MILVISKTLFSNFAFDCATEYVLFDFLARLLSLSSDMSLFSNVSLFSVVSFRVENGRFRGSGRILAFAG